MSLVVVLMLGLAECSLYGSLGKPVLRKDGDYLLGGIFNMGKISKTKSARGDVTFDCKVSSSPSIERAIAFTMTVDAMQDLGNNLTLGYEVYDACDSPYIATYVSTLMSQDARMMGVVGAGKQNLVQPSISPTTSTMIPSVTYIFNEEALLDKNNYPSLVSLIDTELMEAVAMVKMLQALQFKHVDIWYHEFSKGAALYVYNEYVTKAGRCGRLNEFGGKRNLPEGVTLANLVDGVYSNGVAPASAQVLLFNSRYSTTEFLQYVLTDHSTVDKPWRKWEGTTFLFGYSVSRRKWRDGFSQMLNNYTTPGQEQNTFIFFQSELLNLELSEVMSTLNSDTPDNPNPLWQRYSKKRKCSKGCKEKSLSSWMAFVSVATRLMGQQLQKRVTAHAKEGLPCTESLREEVLKDITESRHSVNVFGSEIKDIHFKNSTFASGYTVEAYRVPATPGYGDSYEYSVLGKIGYYSLPEHLDQDMVKLFTPPPRHQTCSITCQPGTYRHFPDVRQLPCCWVCQTCKKNTISTSYNADQCSPCPVNETSVESAATCHPVNKNYIQPGSLYFLLGLGLSVVGVMLTTVVLVYINSKTSSPCYTASDPVYINTILSSLMIGFIMSMVCLIKPDSVRCAVEYMGVVVFGSVLTSSLVYRVLTLHRLLPPKEGEVKMEMGWMFSRCGEMLFNISILLINVGIGVAALLYKGWVYHLHQADHHKDETLICRNEYQLVGTGPFVLPLLLIATTIALSFNMRKNPHNFGECGNIVFGTVVVLMSCIMFLVGYKLSPIEIKPFLRCVILFTVSLAFLACLFIPKLIILYRGTDIKQAAEEVERKELLKATAVMAFKMKKKKKATSPNPIKATNAVTGSLTAAIRRVSDDKYISADI